MTCRNTGHFFVTEKGRTGDVAAYMKYKKGNEKIYGKNGEYLLSDRYIKRVERDIFGSKAANHRDFPSEGNYRRAIEKSLNDIEGKINKDFEGVTDFKGYWLRYKYLNRVYNAVVYLRDCNIGVSYSIDQILKDMYTENKKNGFLRNFRLPKFICPPSEGVEGLGLELSYSGWFEFLPICGSATPMLVIDSNGDYGIVLAGGAGIGVEKGVVPKYFFTKSISSVYQVVGDYLPAESKITGYGIGPFSKSVEWNEEYYEESGEINPIELIKICSEMVWSGQSVEELLRNTSDGIKDGVEIGYSAGFKIHFRDFVYCGKIDRSLAYDSNRN